MSDVGESEARVVDLRRQAIPRLLFSLLHERFTGTVTLQQRDAEPGPRTLTLRGGMPVHTDWVVAGTRLGAQLLARGAVAQADVQRALQHQQETGARLGEVLREDGVVDADALSEALRTQCERRVVRMFGLREGEARLDPRDDVPDEGLQVNVLEVIVRGVEAHYDAARVQQEMGDALLTRRFATTPAFARYRGQFGFADDDTPALDRLATPEGASLQELTATVGDRDRAARAVYVLWACRMLTTPDDTASSKAKVERPTASSDAALSLAEVEARLQGGDDAYAVLGVDNDATTATIDETFRRLAALADPRALPADATDADRSRAHQLFAALAQTRKAALNRRRVLAEHQALRRLDDGKIDRALPLYEELTRIDPDDVEIRAGLLWCRLRSLPTPTSDPSQLQDALAQLDAFIETEPSARLHYYRGFVLVWLDRKRAAIAAFDQAVALDASMLDAQRQARALRAGKEPTRPSASRPDKQKAADLPAFKPKKRPASGHPLWQGRWPAIWIASTILFVLLLVAQIVGRMDF